MNLMTRSAAFCVASIIALSMGARAAPPRPTSLSLAEAATILFEAEAPASTDAARACIADGETAAQIGCLLDVRYRSDKKARALAHTIYDETGAVAGLLPAQDFDGAYRGVLHLVPALPVKGDRQHLQWMQQGLHDVGAFYVDTQVRAGAPLRYRWTDLSLRFFRSVKRRTPSAVAHGWQVAYNLSGSLFTSRVRVRDTLVHEIFHLNDFDHGSDHGAWSERALKDIYSTITSTCGVAAAFAEGPKKAERLRALTACLAPYAPDSIVVVGGTTYAFMPDNGVKEYAADLAKRYFLEEQAGRAHRLKHPWKCQTPQNGAAWQLLVAEFFGGVDNTGPCP